MPHVDQKTYAKHLGVTQPRISQLIREGKLGNAVEKKGRKTLIDQEKADQHLSDAQISVKARPRRRKVVKPEEKKRVIQTGKTDGMSLADAKRVHEQYKAAQAKLDYERKKGDLVPVDEVRKAAFDRARQVRDALMNISSRTASILAAETDEHEVTEILNREIRQALEGLAK